MFKKEKYGKTNINPLKRRRIILVFLFYFIIILNVVIIAIISLKIKIKIVKFKFSSIDKPKIDSNYKINIYFYLFSKIPIFKANITKSKLEKLNQKFKMNNKIKKLNLELMQNKSKGNKNIIKAIKRINMKIEEMDLNVEIGTENARLTSIIVPTISTIIAIYIKNKIKHIEKQTFIISPIYINQNLIKMDISGIFEFNLIHIINMIYVLTKKGEVKKHERTSNRRPYDYSYE